MKTPVCAFLYAYVCRVSQRVRRLLRASERLISLIEAHHKPSTPRPRGTAVANTQAEKRLNINKNA